MQNHETISSYDIAHIALYTANWLCIIVHKVDGFILKYDRTKYLSILMKNLREYLIGLGILLC